MSTRALRRLKGKQRGQEGLDLGELTVGDAPEEQTEEEEQLDTANVTGPSSNSSRRAKKNKAQKNFSNIYEVICDVDNEAEKASPDEDTEKPDGNTVDNNTERTNQDVPKSKSGDKMKKKKKKKRNKTTTENGQVFKNKKTPKSSFFIDSEVYQSQ